MGKKYLCHKYRSKIVFHLQEVTIFVAEISIVLEKESRGGSSKVCQWPELPPPPPAMVLFFIISAL